jgi:hypothetical protein
MFSREARALAMVAAAKASTRQRRTPMEIENAERAIMR